MHFIPFCQISSVGSISLECKIKGHSETLLYLHLVGRERHVNVMPEMEMGERSEGIHLKLFDSWG